MRLAGRILAATLRDLHDFALLILDYHRIGRNPR